MALIVPWTDWLAVSKDAPLYTHFVYMAGHDGYLHYAINAWSLLVIHNLFRWYRVLAAYLVAVLISFIALPAQPMVGASVFTCFFFGFMMPWMWHKQKILLLLTVALMLLTCILPGFAGIPHVVAYVFGGAFVFAEDFVWNTYHFLKR
jgi:hypothetical protein